MFITEFPYDGAKFSPGYDLNNDHVQIHFENWLAMKSRKKYTNDCDAHGIYVRCRTPSHDFLDEER